MPRYKRANKPQITFLAEDEMAKLQTSIERKKECRVSLEIQIRTLRLTLKDLNKSISKDESTLNVAAGLPSHDLSPSGKRKAAKKDTKDTKRPKPERKRSSEQKFKMKANSGSVVILDEDGNGFHASCHECGASTTKRGRAMSFKILYSHYTGIHQQQDGIRRTVEYVIQNCVKAYVDDGQNEQTKPEMGLDNISSAYGVAVDGIECSAHAVGDAKSEDGWSEDLIDLD